MRRLFQLSLALAIALTVLVGLRYPGAYWAMVVVAPLGLLGIYDMVQSHNSILRNFPVLGHFRYFFEFVSPEIQQYFIERNTDGTPLSRNHRRIVFERSRHSGATHPFGTELDLYDERHVALRHSMYPAKRLEEPPRVTIGGPECRQPYSASLLNISAMSFGAISSHAILAMSNGAKMGGFYHNTGEGGLSDYHLRGGGDLVWQIGTAYFGCRTKDGRFDPKPFEEQANKAQVKMIELKLSQGAKPGHGGVLPAVKNTPEIARIRILQPHTMVVSPPGHPEFSDAQGMLELIQRLRELCGGKPVGIKLCVGRKDELVELCRAMQSAGTAPDFITVDGAEGGTGAAPLEYSDSVGLPLMPALAFVDRTLRDFDLRDRVRVIASGKALTAVSIIERVAYGADLCNSARAFMLSVGCIQAQRCDTNKCPTGVATQDPMLVKGLSVEDKKTQVAKFHHNTLEAVLDLMASCGVTDLGQFHPEMFIHGAQAAKE
ncbi:MAG: FMN-binding glutamate synthase family protein [Acidobacteria bacterium]|nr:FMN-binding glutamate synthase family protein [Acidobacteriota bacterium]